MTTRYAVMMTLKKQNLAKSHPIKSSTAAIQDIELALNSYGFHKAQEGLFIGNDAVDAVQAVIAVRETSKAYPWLRKCIAEIKMLRIEEINDLTLAL